MQSAVMDTAGFVLAGGGSTRMGRDKALLPWHGRTLIEYVAGVVREAVENVAVIGHPRYRELGLTVIPDAIPNSGPLGGLLTAMQVSDSERVLVVACDMPEITPEVLRGLVRAKGDAVVAETEGRLHPLCAVYDRHLFSQIEAAVAKRALRMHDFLSTVEVQRWPVSDANLLKNWNSPQDLPA